MKSRTARKEDDDLRWRHLVADVADFSRAFDAAAAMPIDALAQIRVVVGKRPTRRPDVIAGRRVVARSAYHCVDGREQTRRHQRNDEDGNC